MQIIGQTAVEMLEAQRAADADFREHITVPPTLVPRQSTDLPG
jgi:DNA-binding LacI/PurR family transcriptional regulator